MAKDIEGSLYCRLRAVRCGCRREFELPELKSEPDFSRGSAGRNAQKLVQVGVPSLCIRLRETIEVLAQDFAGQNNGKNVQVAVLNLGAYEMTLPPVQLGLGDVSDWRLVQAAVDRGVSLCNVNLSSCGTSHRKGKRDFVPDPNVASQHRRY